MISRKGQQRSDSLPIIRNVWIEEEALIPRGLSRYTKRTLTICSTYSLAKGPACFWALGETQLSQLPLSTS
jgi:hypothetical protein